MELVQASNQIVDLIQRICAMISVSKYCANSFGWSLHNSEKHSTSSEQHRGVQGSCPKRKRLVGNLTNKTNWNSVFLEPYQNIASILLINKLLICRYMDPYDIKFGNFFYFAFCSKTWFTRQNSLGSWNDSRIFGPRVAKCFKLLQFPKAARKYALTIIFIPSKIIHWKYNFKHELTSKLISDFV